MSDLAQTAKKLLDKFGIKVLMVDKLSSSDVDPITGDTTAVTPNEYAPFAYLGQYKTGEIDGSNIQAGDIRMICDNTVLPLVGWFVIGSRLTYRIMSVQQIQLSGVDVIYICQLRAN